METTVPELGRREMGDWVKGGKKECQEEHVAGSKVCNGGLGISLMKQSEYSN